MVLKTLIYLPLNHQMWLLAKEHFIAHVCDYKLKMCTTQELSILHTVIMNLYFAFIRQK